MRPRTRSWFVDQMCFLFFFMIDACISQTFVYKLVLTALNNWNCKKFHKCTNSIKGGCIIQQAFDGYVTVERKYGSELFTMKTSPSNGKARLQSSFIYITASEGPESHLFVKSKDRRIHHSEKVCTVMLLIYYFSIQKDDITIRFCV